MPHPREQSLALLLRDASGDGDDEIGPDALQRGELADLAAELLLRLLAHAARVEDDEIGVLGLVDRDPPGRAQDSAHTVGIVGIHLAAEGVDDVAEQHGGART